MLFINRYLYAFSICILYSYIYIVAVVIENIHREYSLWHIINVGCLTLCMDYCAVSSESLKTSDRHYRWPSGSLPGQRYPRSRTIRAVQGTWRPEQTLRGREQGAPWTRSSPRRREWQQPQERGVTVPTRQTVMQPGDFISCLCAEGPCGGGRTGKQSQTPHAISLSTMPHLCQLWPDVSLHRTDTHMYTFLSSFPRPPAFLTNSTVSA